MKKLSNLFLGFVTFVFVAVVGLVLCYFAFPNFKNYVDDLINPSSTETYDLTINSTKTIVTVMHGEQEIHQGENVLTKGEEYIITATAEECCTLTILTVNGQAFESGSTIEVTTNIVIVANSAVNTIAPPIVVEPEEPVALPASYFTFDDGALTGFSAEGRAAYDAGELTELVLPSSYSLGELVTEEVTYTEFFDLDMYCMENGYNFTFVNSAGESIAVTSEEEFFNNYEDLRMLLEENQSITVTMQVQKFVDGVTYNVSELSNRAFNNISNITKITVPNTYIKLARPSIKTLEEINILDGNPNYKSIDGIVYSADMKVLEFAPMGVLSVNVPEGVEAINDFAFLQSSLIEINLPSTLLTIGVNCFTSTLLRSIDFPNSLVSIGSSAFSHTYLGDVSIPSNVVELGYLCFGHCVSLKFVEFEVDSKLTVLPGCCFYQCLSLNNIVWPSSLVEIGSSAFEECYSLSNALLPATVKKIDSDAFQSCLSLWSVSLPDQLEFIGSYAFADCDTLYSIVVPENVSFVGMYSFAGCSSLNSVVFDNSLGHFDTCLFDGSSNLQVVDCSSFLAVPSISSSGDWLSYDLKVVVPDALYDEWIVAENWSNYADHIVKASEYVA